MNNKPTVSIIIPLYGCEAYLRETLDSVMAQTFTDWEAILINDCSPDNSLSIAQEYQSRDSRFRVFSHDVNKGAHMARNTALEFVEGRYIAYLDSDDVWMPEKLQLQLDFMAENNVYACITGYQTIEEDGTYRNTVMVPKRTGYKQMLGNTLTCTHTAVFDTEKVSKDLLVMPTIGAAEDLATWLNVMKAGYDFYGLDAVMAKYRKHGGSRSSNKLRAMKNTWNIYRKIEKINIFISAYYFIGYAYHAVKKRLK